MMAPSPESSCHSSDCEGDKVVHAMKRLRIDDGSGVCVEGGELGKGRRKPVSPPEVQDQAMQIDGPAKQVQKEDESTRKQKMMEMLQTQLRQYKSQYSMITDGPDIAPCGSCVLAFHDTCEYNFGLAIRYLYQQRESVKFSGKIVMTQKHENQVPQNSSDPNSAPTPLFDLNAILGPDPEGEIPDGGDIREYPSRICWFSELLGRICDDSYLDSEAKKLVEEKRDAYLETLKRGSNAKELFDSLVDYVLELASVIPPASPKADGEDPKITQSSSLFLPLSVAYIRMESPEVLDARDCNMDDMQLQGILRSRQSGLGIVKRVNVSGNKLSDAAVCSLTKDLVQSEAKLETLDLSGNQLISDRTYLDLCQRLRSLQFTSLQSLSIAGIHVHGAAMLELLSNLNSSTTPSLECLNLADTQLGMRDDVGCDALAATLSQIRKLSSLDISHNYMRAKHLHIIGESLALMDSISVLNISSNSGGMLPSEPKLPAIASLCSVLGSIASLTEVNLASTGMNDETAFILSDSLANHHNIKRIDISGNANVGRFGIFSLLKLLLFKKDGVNSINLNDSLRNTNTRVFNFADPSGTYSLNLQSLRDIAIARQCFNIWELSRAFLEKTLIGIEIDSKPFVPMKDAEEVWQLPERGILRFTARFKLFNEDGTLSEVGKPTVITREIMHRFVSGVYSEIRSVEQKQILLHSIASNFD